MARKPRVMSIKAMATIMYKIKTTPMTMNEIVEMVRNNASFDPTREEELFYHRVANQIVARVKNADGTRVVVSTGRGKDLINLDLCNDPEKLEAVKREYEKNLYAQTYIKLTKKIRKIYQCEGQISFDDLEQDETM